MRERGGAIGNERVVQVGEREGCRWERERGAGGREREGCGRERGLQVGERERGV